MRSCASNLAPTYPGSGVRDIHALISDAHSSGSSLPATRITPRSLKLRIPIQQIQEAIVAQNEAYSLSTQALSVAKLHSYASRIAWVTVPSPKLAGTEPHERRPCGERSPSQARRSAE
jgi:hypothetical protein